MVPLCKLGLCVVCVYSTCTCTYSSVYRLYFDYGGDVVLSMSVECVCWSLWILDQFIIKQLVVYDKPKCKSGASCTCNRPSFNRPSEWQILEPLIIDPLSLNDKQWSLFQTCKMYTYNSSYNECSAQRCWRKLHVSSSFLSERGSGGYLVREVATFIMLLVLT